MRCAPKGARMSGAMLLPAARDPVSTSNSPQAAQVPRSGQIDQDRYVVACRDPCIAADGGLDRQQVAPRFLRADGRAPCDAIDVCFDSHSSEPAANTGPGGFEAYLHCLFRRDGDKMPTAALARPEPERCGDGDHARRTSIPAL